MFKKHPKGLLAASLSNMGERFGFYVMMAILTLFLMSKFGLDKDKAGIIYSLFYFFIYALALLGGYIADKTKKYKNTIAIGIATMAIGYTIIAIPTETPVQNMPLMLTVTCVGLFVIAFGNGLFKGNLQAIVGQLYDQNPEYEEKRDEGFSLFYMFINIGAIFAPLFAIGIRNLWLQSKGFLYDTDLPALCHSFLNGNIKQEAAASRLVELTEKVSITEGVEKLDAVMMTAGEKVSILAADSIANATGSIAQVIAPITEGNVTLKMSEGYVEMAHDQLVVNGQATLAANTHMLEGFANNYLNVFNTGFHYAFAIAIVAMLISLVVFMVNKNKLPDPGNKVAAKAEVSKEQITMSTAEIKQRLYALFAVFGVVIFFWFSFHQNGLTLTFFARDYVNLSMVDINLFGFIPLKGAEIFQVLNPMFVVCLTPVVLGIFGWLKNRGIELSAPKKIAIGMGIAASAYLVMSIGSMGLVPDAEREAMGGLADAARVTPLLLVCTYLILTVAELFISPLGLSFVSKVAPPHLQGIMQGCWLGATAIGNSLLFIGAIFYESLSLSAAWAIFVGACLLSMIVMMSMVKWLEKVTK